MPKGTVAVYKVTGGGLQDRTIVRKRRTRIQVLHWKTNIVRAAKKHQAGTGDKIRKGHGYFRDRARGGEEDTPQGRVVEAVLTVGVIIATLRILRWTTSRTVLSREQHVTHARNWDLSNANVGALEEELKSGIDW